MWGWHEPSRRQTYVSPNCEIRPRDITRLPGAVRIDDLSFKEPALKGPLYHNNTFGHVE